MSYRAYITRNSDYPYLRNRLNPITEQEWKLVCSHFEVGSEIEELPYYDAFLGEIVLQNPVPESIEQLVKLSKMLDAIVRGSEGEIYISGTYYYFPEHPDFS